MDDTVPAIPSAKRAGSSAPPPTDEAGELPRGTTLDHYVILKRLGRGGMGVVYLAFDSELERRVAIKVLRPEASAIGSVGEIRTRLLREAQAMAKVSHANVVAAYDVGTFGDEVFVAMEYVAGVTLREWRKVAKRSAREIVAAYVQAGRGLEAAHAEGILHRDFKPDNVLVDDRGRVRVLDFGLARLESAGPGEPESAAKLALYDTGVAHSDALSTPLTRVGTIMGTPAYMAPEQLLGERVTARTDQFSFCVALYEALYGELPFDGDTVNARAGNIHAGRVVLVPKGARVPRALRRVLLRGLSGSAESRYASMGELIDALDGALRASAWRAVGFAMAGAAVLAAGLAVSRSRSAPPPVCVGAEQEIASAWGLPERQAISKAFAASGNARAGAIAGRVAKMLDAYAASWAKMRTESCQATRVRGVQSDEALDLRTACLDQRRSELSATIGLLAKADEKLVDDAATAVSALSALDGCADVPSLRAPYAMPHDPVRRRAIEALRQKVTEGTALLNARRFDEAMAVVAPAAHEAEEAHNRQLQAEARFVMARADVSRGKYEDALRTLVATAADASVARDDTIEALAWIWLVRVAGFDLDRFAESETYATIAAAAVERAGNRDELRWQLLRYHAHARSEAEDDAAALTLYREALGIVTRLHGASSLQASWLDGDIAAIESNSGQLREAIAHYGRALEEATAATGEGDRSYVIIYANMALAEVWLGDGKEAVEMSRRALATVQAADSARAEVAMTLACSLLLTGEIEEARREAKDAVTKLLGIYGDANNHVAAGYEEWAHTANRRHLDVDALEAADATLASAGAGESERLMAHSIRALTRARTGGGRAALDEASVALAEDEKGAPGSPATFPLMLPLLAVGEAALAAGEPARALGVLERAATVAEAAEPFPEHRADIHLALARAIMATRGDASRARTLAERAAKEYEETGLGAEVGVARRFARQIP